MLEAGNGYLRKGGTASLSIGRGTEANVCLLREW